MDMARAIHKIDPKAEYTLNHSQADDKQEIVHWRGPGAAPSQAMLDEAWRLCLDDDLRELEQELERQQALIRVKADSMMDDLVSVLKL